ncbi:YIP1 family protein [Halosimplex amylolyticum]|uniref:YIP1 family protein n=1 Tax=Halosimplex amylolyticum TaxID=3396616 RepID=UPI003F571EE6
MRLSTLVTDPRTFFERRREDPSLVGPTIVVALHALIVLATMAVILRAFSGLVGRVDAGSLVYAAGDQRVAAPRQFVLSLGLTPVVYLALWVGVAAVVYLVSIYFDGEGPFRRVLAFVGWTLVPTLVPTVVVAVVVTALFVDAPTFGSEAAVEEWVRSSVMGDPAYVGVRLLRPLFTLWMAYLWIVAAECARGLTRRQALVAAGLPVALAVLNALGTYVGFVAQALGFLP